MNHLLRELAPLSDTAWAEVTDEATQSLAQYLAARKLVDFKGPLGYDTAAINTGRVQELGDQPGAGVTATQRELLPLVELRRRFTLQRSELEAIDRGAADADLDEVRFAARDLALAEDHMVFDGYAAANIGGIASSSPHDAVTLTTDYSEYPSHVASAVELLKEAGVVGPYALALGPRCYAGVTKTENGGHPLIKHLGLILGGPVVWAPAVDGAVVLSQRGGDFELTVGQDTSIAYRSHDADTVTLELVETATFLAAAPEAAVALRYLS